MSAAEDHGEPDARLLSRAGVLLSRRSYGPAELEARLARGAGTDAAAAAVSRLVEHGLVDDRVHAEALAVTRLGQGWGPARIRHDLDRAGVAAAIVREVLDGLSPEALDGAARRAVDGRTGASALSRLGQRGFDEDVAERLGLAADES